MILSWLVAATLHPTNASTLATFTNRYAKQPDYAPRLR